MSEFYGLEPGGLLPATALAQLDTARREVIAAGRPDIPATTPYTSAQLNAMPVGSVYRSTTGPQGAWKWRKTDATSWTAVDADTGWRIMPNPAAFETSVQGLRLRRIGPEVFLAFRLAPSAALVGQSRQTNAPILFDSLPAGFGYSSSETYLTHGQTYILASTNGVLSGHSSGNRLSIGGMSGTWTAGDAFNGTAQWTTGHAWPTTLPGTAA